METLRQYEIVYITAPHLTRDDYYKIVNRLQGVMEKHKGKIVKYVSWGTRQLAYRLKKQNEGTYFHMVFVGDNKVVAEMERNLRIMDNILRYLTVKLADDVDMASVQTESVEPEILDTPIQLGSEGKRDFRRSRYGGHSDDFGDNDLDDDEREEPEREKGGEGKEADSSGETENE